MIHAGVLLIPSLTILLISSSIGFLISFTVFFILENSVVFFLIRLVLCSPFPWLMFYLNILHIIILYSVSDNSMSLTCMFLFWFYLCCLVSLYL